MNKPDKQEMDNNTRKTITQVKVGEFRGVQCFDTNGIECHRGMSVILEVDRGVEYGRVVSSLAIACPEKGEPLAGKIIRIATQEDMATIEKNRQKAKEALETCLSKVQERRMHMQVVNAEYAFDGSKIIFFFTAEGRIDFRSLVKDLARIFRVRIELRQIGVRDKAKIIGGIGVCGRELCCSSYMKGFHPLSIKMPKEQGLPLNPSRISGICGRIKCCMAYEFSVYRFYAKRLPRVGEKITTPQGPGKVVEVNVLQQYVRVNLGEGKATKVSYATQD